MQYHMSWGSDSRGFMAQSAVMTTAHGDVNFHAISWSAEETYAVLSHQAKPPVTALVRLRLQAACLTSTAFASAMCDCGAQIDLGVRMTARVPGSVLIYLPQEGRGYGLISKVEVMARMNSSLTLEDAQRAVGRPESSLSYRRIPAILKFLGLDGSVILVTDSEEKVDGVRQEGVCISSVESLIDLDPQSS